MLDGQKEVVSTMIMSSGWKNELELELGMEG